MWGNLNSLLQYGTALLREVEDKEENAGGQDVFGASVPKEVCTGAAKQDGEGNSLQEGAEGDGEEEEEGEDEAKGEEEGDAPETSKGEEGAQEPLEDPLQLAWEVGCVVC